MGENVPDFKTLDNGSYLVPASFIREYLEFLTTITKLQAELDVPKTDLHPSPNAPKHLNRFKEELLPWPYNDDHESGCWLTTSQWEGLVSKYGLACAQFWACNMSEWKEQDFKGWKKKVNHSLHIQNMARRKVADGYVWGEHPESGAGYYKEWVLRNAINGGRYAR